MQQYLPAKTSVIDAVWPREEFIPKILQSKVVTADAEVANLTATLNSPCTPGNFLIAMTQRRAVGTLSVSAGWTEIYNNDSVSFGQRAMHIRAASGIGTITYTNNSNDGNIAILLYEISGLDPTFPFAGLTQNATGSTVNTLSSNRDFTQIDSRRTFSIACAATRSNAPIGSFSWTNGWGVELEVFTSGTGSIALASAIKLMVPGSPETTVSWTNALRCNVNLAVFNLKGDQRYLPFKDSDIDSVYPQPRSR